MRAAAWVASVAGALVYAGACMAAPCGAGAATSGVVKAVLDEHTLALEDGRLLRLAGLDIPPGETPALARKFLTDELLGRNLTAHAASPPDRHGRLPAFIFLSPGGLERFVQHAMVNQGLARFAPPAGSRACADELLAREREARAAGRGLWAQAAHAVQRADDPGAVQALRGRFALVEGRVLSVRESGGTVYVNFGRRWSEDFTVTVAKRNERSLAAGGLAVRQLERQTVRVRGWIEERGGPWIEVIHPEQVEVVRN